MNLTNRQVVLNDQQPRLGSSVLYVMSRDQRTQDNHALLLAQSRAEDTNSALHVLFVLYPKTGVRSQEHYQFMIGGLKDVAASLEQKGIVFSLIVGTPAEIIPNYANSIKAQEIIFDCNPLRGPRAMQRQIAQTTKYRVSAVDTHNIIPIWKLSDKEEFAAHTIRSKIHKNLEEWLVEPPVLKNHAVASQHNPSQQWEEAEKVISGIKRSGIEVQQNPGETAAHATSEDFIHNRLANYAADRNVPTINGQSNLSPYLHFGHISALRIALSVMDAVDKPPLLFREAKLASYEGEPNLMDSANAFLEELIVRKELADNFCFYNPKYDSLAGARDWARDSLTEHQADVREHIYTREELESAQTHDDAWNAAQCEMMKTGKMHGYMRMYWAKKILEWSSSADEAIKTTVYLNDHYSVDGGDPNGYTGIMWSIAGIHDRPWFERDIFGKIRYMNRGGLERRFNVEEYIKRWLS